MSKVSEERADQRFDEIVMFDLKCTIAEAFLNLESKLRVSNYDVRCIKEVEHEAIRKKANQMKLELNRFIDSQAERIISESKSQLQNESQVTE